MSRKFGTVLACIIGMFAAAAVVFAGGTYTQANTLAPAALAAGVEAGSVDATLAITNDCRYGVTGNQDNYMAFLASQNVGVGLNLDFSARDGGTILPGAEFVQVIKVQQQRDGSGNYLNGYNTNIPVTEASLGALVLNNRGSLWLIGNEPDRGPNNPTDPNRVQDDTFPAEYAVAYHDIYTFIKSHDASAQVANASLVEVTPGRLHYLDTVWSTYQSLYGTTMPVDVWNMHIYILPEANHDGTAPNEIASVAKGSPLATALKEGTYIVGDTQWCNKPGYYCTAAHDSIAKFGDQVTQMRTWMQAHGQQNKPLVLSEFGLLYPYFPNPTWANCWVKDEYGNCFSPARAAQFLTASFNYLNTTTNSTIGDPLDNNRLVQQWLWFSTHTSQPGEDGTTQGKAGYISNLISGTVPAFNVVGQAFKSAAQGMPQTLNLLATSTNLDHLNVVGNLMSVTVRVGVMNNGSIRPGAPVKVTVYADPTRTVELGSGYLYNAPGCARRETYAFVSWTMPAIPTGPFTYYVRVDPGNASGETTMADNDTQGSFNLTPTRILLPTIQR